MNINLYIERLVLEGVNIAPSQRRLLQDSIAAELTQLLHNGGLEPNLVAGAVLARLSTKAIHLTDNNPIQAGRQIAQSLYGGIGHE